ncbi:MAG: Rrf2 family transcriptional regulator [Bacteroidales bacterium]|jgi:Rrf2 family protein|nr:Rrf2 family transcriptional regulator [Bacteroidales bacterium]
MLSNSSRYGIRAVIYLAARPDRKIQTGISTISRDLELPAPFLAKILQQLVRHKILYSLKGPHGGFSLLKDPKEITLFEIVKVIEGEDIFQNCVIHNMTCREVHERGEECILHSDYSLIRKDLVDLFRNRTIHDLLIQAGESDRIVI